MPLRPPRPQIRCQHVSHISLILNVRHTGQNYETRGWPTPLLDVRGHMFFNMAKGFVRSPLYPGNITIHPTDI